PAGLFRAHIRGRSEDDASARCSNRHRRRLSQIRRPALIGVNLCKAKVEHFHDSAGGDLDVGGLEIAMDDAFLVRHRQGVCNLTGNGQRVPQGNWTGFQAIGERRTRHQLEHDAPHVGSLFEAVYGRDGGMTERGEPASLALEPRDSLRIRQERVRKDLDGYTAPQYRVSCAIDLAHRAGPDAGKNLVWSDASP